MCEWLRTFIIKKDTDANLIGDNLYQNQVQLSRWEWTFGVMFDYSVSTMDGNVTAVSGSNYVISMRHQFIFSVLNIINNPFLAAWMAVACPSKTTIGKQETFEIFMNYASPANQSNVTIYSYPSVSYYFIIVVLLFIISFLY